MDIGKIQSFMSYKTNYNEDPREELDAILARLDYLSAEEKKELIQTYEYTLSCHKGVKRLSGEPYIVHPLRVLGFLCTLSPDLPSMKAALLHDLIEDTEVTYDDILAIFGEEVATLCDGLVKVSKVRYRGEERQIETLKKTFLAMAKDLRVIIIKIADRVHNIQTLHFHPKKEKRNRIAEETLKIYVPIAKRLGLYVFQGFLENGAFAVLHPRDYKKIVKHVLKQYGHAQNFKESGVQRLQLLCEEEHVAYSSVVGRLKSPYRIRKKLGKYNNDISKIMDVLAFRIITETVNDCYTILGLIHKHYTPIFSKMKDYIALPKPNGYKSLHTTVLGMFESPVEIQVRTQAMDDIANYGVAAHYAYSDESLETVSDAQSQWIKKLQDIVQKYSQSTDKESFKNELDIEILQKNIFVYTPKGDIIELPLGSTVLDFAFRVHTDIGLKFKNAFINGRIVPIDYKIKTGDIVSIETFKNKYTANASWNRFLHTPTAKSKLLRFLRVAEKDEVMKIVTERLNRKLATFGLPAVGSKNDKITKLYNHEELERILYKLRDKQITFTKFIKDLYPELSEQETKKATTQPTQTIPSNAPALVKALGEYGVIIDGNRLKEVLLCPECRPEKTQKIIARTGKDGVKVHTLQCSALDTIEYKKLLEAHRDGEGFNKYVLDLQLLASDKPGMLLKILRTIEFLGINVIGIRTDPSKIKKKTKIIVSMAFDNPSKIAFLLDELKQLKQSVKILSTAIH